MNKTAREFLTSCEAVYASLLSVPENLASVPWREGGWTRKQVLGHMIDSAANNHQRFVRASLDGGYTGPFYAQDAWVDAHGYNDMQWSVLLEWWRVYHDILKAVVERIPGDRYEAVCHIGDNGSATLRFLIEDYIAHQNHHLEQILTA